VSTLETAPLGAAAAGARAEGGRRSRGRVLASVPAAQASRRLRLLAAQGEPMLWVMGAGLGACLLMIVGLLALIAVQGTATFWPTEVVRVETVGGGALMGEVTRTERYVPQAAAAAVQSSDEASKAEAATATGTSLTSQGAPRRAAHAGADAERRLVRTGNYEITGEHFTWVSDFEIVAESRPPWAVVFERSAWGRFYGVPAKMLVDGEAVAASPANTWAAFVREHGPARDRWRERRRLETEVVGDLNRRIERSRLEVRTQELAHGAASVEVDHARRAYARTQAATDRELVAVQEAMARLAAENDRYRLVVTTADGREATLALADVVRAYPANRLGVFDKLGVYLSRWAEFLSAEPREANSEGGVFPAIFGTVVMTLVMSLIVTPIGVLAALYLREYAKPGPLVSAVRIAVNNLAGVPSIVFGVFGLGFFCYIVGASIDELLFAAKLPSPTFGTGGLLWASLTLALLTLPVVIVATEEALAAVPSSMREGSYACGASKWQTIRRIVLPRALPGILTGMILALARGAGEVAPLMLVGAVKLAPELPVDALFPFVHLERSFMHLGFHIYDLGFQSQNSEAAKPMVYTTTLLLVAIIATLNVAAVSLRSRLRRRFAVGQF
jgi:phosphate transport system permease protein